MISRYRILTHIGTTAGSHLYLAQREEDGAPVMLKQLDPDQASTADFARFRREYLLLQPIDVAGIAKPPALVKEGECLTMVLDNFAGEPLESLASILGRGPPPDWQTCLGIASGLAHILAGVHAAHVIHRDIRPANILVVPENHHVLLADFSIASSQDPALSSDSAVARVEDWAYLSPEQTGRMNRTVD